jgi:aspartyl-tRNA(Asn)/glutamyl-tRNA(Gln) amidotransferase subunit B
METMNGIDEKHITMIANLFTSVLLAEEKSAEYLNDLPDAKKLNDLAEMNEKKELSSTATKEVFLRLFDPQMKGRDTKAIAKELGLIQENDLGALEVIVDAVLKKPETKKAQDDFRNGEEKVIGFLVGQVMKESKGKANPSAVQQILRDKLK